MTQTLKPERCAAAIQGTSSDEDGLVSVRHHVDRVLPAGHEGVRMGHATNMRVGEFLN